MKTFKKILVPTDFSEASKRALEYAFTFASALDLEILMLHVIDARADTALVYSYREREEDQDMEQVSHQSMGEEAKRVLEEEAQRGITYDQKLKVTTMVRHGVPYDQIIRVAAREEVDFIVMGARGRTAMEGIFIGGVAEKVSRRAPCPVFLTRQARHVKRASGKA